ncbi:hypothetical protein [Iningainema tapete]|uniref:Uncharacterized protein n=1 Tax=Iningainema tapete BLCC-T55 TaxID=2748662 RepID=A0A8J7BXX8_9CYAN|nr:hypothetical protein [Iningainema tapete]MBD2773553.1 hypothetical protein [Iningainema tapete BLCC-T55]
MTGVGTFDTDPTLFGLEGFPIGSVIYFGSSNNQLFAYGGGIGTLDFATGLITGSTTEIITVRYSLWV